MAEVAAVLVVAKDDSEGSQGADHRECGEHDLGDAHAVRAGEVATVLPAPWVVAGEDKRGGIDVRGKALSDTVRVSDRDM